MEISILFFYNLLSSTQAWGGAATLLLLLASFAGVHAVKLSSKGYSFYKQTENNLSKEKAEQAAPETKTKKKPANTVPAKAKKRTPPQKQSTPIYYLVEKKRIRKKPVEYTEPKRIRFQEEEEFQD